MKIESTIDVKQTAHGFESIAVVDWTMKPKKFESATRTRAINLAKSSVLRMAADMVDVGMWDNLTAIEFKVVDVKPDGLKDEDVL